MKVCGLIVFRLNGFKSFLSILLTITVCTHLCGCRQRGVMSYRTSEGVVWHTTYHAVYESDRDLSDVIIGIASKVEKSLSPFDDKSLISLINRNESSDVDSMIETVFNRSVYFNRISNGLFDPTVAPLVNLWGFGYEDAANEPDKNAIDTALLTVGIDECTVVDGKLLKKHPDTQFDFSAITKGYGVDLIAQAFIDRGVKNFMIEIGGEIVVRGYNPQGELWRISIDKPQLDALPGEESVDILYLTDCAVATSGNYRNYRINDGKVVGHTISPVTGYPISTEVLSATVVAPSCIDADALATTLMAVPLATAAEIIYGLGEGYYASLVVASDDGETMQVCINDI